MLPCSEKYHSEAEQINHHATHRETEELFRSMKCGGSSFKTVRRSNKCDREKLKNFFLDHFSSKVKSLDECPTELKATPHFMEKLYDKENMISCALPAILEVKGVLTTSLKNGKASTGAPSEFFKNAVD